MIGRFLNRTDGRNDGTGDGGDAERVPPGQSVVTGFPVLTYGPTPRVAAEALELRVFGLARERVFDWEALHALPQSEIRRDFHCVTSWSKLGVGWSGVRSRDLLGAIEVDPEARFVLLHCYGGYTTNLRLDDFAAEDCLLASALEGEPIPEQHGGPLRMIVPHLYAWKSAKWLTGIEFLEHDAPGFWERNGYHNRGDPWREERYG